MLRITRIDQLDPALIPAIEERINAKIRTLPDHLIPGLLEQLGDPPAVENITREYVTLISMTIQDQVRRVVDKRFKNHIEGLISKYPREIQAHLEDRPHVGGPPASWWNAKQKQLEESLALFLVTAYGLSAKWHGMSQAIAEVEASKFAAARARTVAAGFIENSRTAFEQLQSKWAAAVTVVGGLSMAADNRSSKSPGPPASAAGPSRTEVRDGLKSIFSPARIETMAVSETTGAISHAGEATQQQAGLVSEADTWWTEADGRVCEVCEPLHGEPRSVWAATFSLGPPAHPRCRCRIGYAG